MSSLDDFSRRTFLKSLGASIALAGLDGCSRMPAERILPYVESPDLVPGIPVHYATSLVLDGFATGLIVEAHEGHPTKIEGNPAHPASLGAAGVFEQASLLQLYDPDRGRFVLLDGGVSAWAAFGAAFHPSVVKARAGSRGERVALLLEPTSSPLIGAELAKLREVYPAIRVHFLPSHASGGEPTVERGLITQYSIRDADVVLTVGSDFLAAGPFCLRYAREFADRRRTPLDGMNRLYAAETSFTVTGTAADHRLRCRPSELEPLLESLLNAIRTGGRVGTPWLGAAAADLLAHRGRSLVIAGPSLPVRAQALALAVNAALGNIGKTIWHSRSPLLDADEPAAPFADLVAAMRAGEIDTLICAGGNPSYATPGALAFTEAMRHVPNTVYAGLYRDETARAARWFLPAAHYLECWGDARARDGTYSIVQPLVRPLFAGKSTVELLCALRGELAPDNVAALRDAVRAQLRGGSHADVSAAIRLGMVQGSAFPRATATPRAELLAEGSAPAAARGGTIEVLFAPDARVHDGCFANNGWLQELPDPITKLTWNNAALISPATAQRLGAATGDTLLFRANGAELRMPALIVAGHADDAATVHFGYGRAGEERVAEHVGTNVYPFWPDIGSFVRRDVAVERAAPHSHTALAITQGHWTMDGRDQARSTSIEAYRTSVPQPQPPARKPLTIYDPQAREPATLQWAMTIDLGVCTGCSACVVACQSENNIPVVGPDDVALSREMHWMRIDRYIEGAPGEPRAVSQPMLCQHCENAPCEYVCPVEATVHSPDGLNEMVYNRCVGTRFCSNNCPYKVRRFNWFDYNKEISETEQLAKNPDVTVRARGVMEKCTFCVQRIREADIAADREGRARRGGDVVTACQQACPTRAIVFGSLTEPGSDVVRTRNEPRSYAVLDQLGTVPRVRYMARVRNPNPALEHGT